jgi:hypothetical protein
VGEKCERVTMSRLASKSLCCLRCSQDRYWQQTATAIAYLGLQHEMLLWDDTMQSQWLGGRAKDGRDLFQYSICSLAENEMDQASWRYSHKLAINIFSNEAFFCSSSCISLVLQHHGCR